MFRTQSLMFETPNMSDTNQGQIHRQQVEALPIYFLSFYKYLRAV